MVRDVASHGVRVVCNVACVLILTPLLVDRLGLAGFGCWALAMTGLAWLLAAELGAVSAVTKLAAEGRGRSDPGLERAAIRVLGRRLLLTAALVGPAAWLAAPWAARVIPELPIEATTASFRWVAAAAAILLPLSLGPGLLQGRAQHLLCNLVSVGGRLAQLGLTIAAVLWRPEVEAVVVATLAGLALTALGHAIAAYAARPRGRTSSATPGATAVSIREQGRAFGWINVAVLLGGQTDVILAGVFAGPAGAGLYRIAERTTQHLAAFVKQLSGVLGPEVARAHAAGSPQELKTLFLLGCRWTLLIGVPPLALLTTWGDWLLGTWLGPEGRAAGPLAALVWATLLVSLVQAQAVQQLALTGQHRRVARVFVAAAVANVTASCLLGSVWGIWGIAAGTLISVTLLDRAWFLPVGCRSAGVSLRELSRWTLSRNASLGALLGLVLAGLRWAHPEPDLLPGLGGLGAILVLAGCCWLAWAARADERALVLRPLRRLARTLLTRGADTKRLSPCDS